MISSFWLNTNTPGRFFLSLPLQVGLPLVFVGLAMILMKRGRPGVAVVLSASACIQGALQVALLVYCLFASIVIRGLGFDPSFALELAMAVALGVAWLSQLALVGVARSWWQPGRQLLLRLDQLGPWRLSTFAVDLVAMQVGLMLLLIILGFPLFLTSPYPVIQGVGLLVALGLWVPTATLVWRAVRFAETESIVPGAASTPMGQREPSFMLKWLVVHQLRVLLGVAACLIGGAVLLVPRATGWWPLAIAVLLGAATIWLPSGWKLSGGNPEQLASIAVARRTARSLSLGGILLVLACGLVLPGPRFLGWCLDWLRPVLATDERLADEVLRSEFKMYGAVGEGFFNASSWLEDELQRRGPPAVPAIVRVLRENRAALSRRSRAPGSWFKGGRFGSRGPHLIRYLGIAGVEHPKQMLREWLDDRSLNRGYPQEIARVLACLDRGGVVLPHMSDMPTTRETPQGYQEQYDRACTNPYPKGSR